jgi:hypothetical protein
MKNLLSRLLITAAIVLQLGWLAWPHLGPYPSHRLQQAIESTASSPKSVQDAAIHEALRLDSDDRSRNAALILMLAAGVDIALIYFFWNHGKRKSGA